MKYFKDFKILFAGILALFALAAHFGPPEVVTYVATHFSIQDLGLIGLAFAAGELHVVKHTNLDADESIFFARELEYVKSQTYDKKYAQLKARLLLPVSNEADPWADAIVYQQFDHVGVAKIIQSYGMDLPKVDLKGKEFINPIRSLGACYGYNVMEIRKSRARGKGLEQRKADAAKRAMMELENRIAFSGDSDTGLKGFINHTSISEDTIVSDGTGNASEWSTKTAAQILRDMHQLANFIVQNTKGVEIPDTLLLPLTSFNYINSTPYSTLNGDTILDIFKKQSQYIKNIEWLNELETAGDTASKRMMAYRRSADALTLEIPQDFEQFDPQPRGLYFDVPCHSRIGGVIIYYPLSIAFMDGI